MNNRSQRAPTDASWEAVSERVASEVGRSSEILNERMLTDVKQVMRTRSNSSLATTSDPHRATQEDVRRLDFKVEVSLTIFSREVAEFREWMSKAISDQANQAHMEKEAFHVLRFPVTAVAVNSAFVEGCRSLKTLTSNYHLVDFKCLK